MNRIEKKKIEIVTRKSNKKQSIQKTDEINVLIGMKHFTQMIMMMNPSIHATVVPPQTAVSHLTKFLTKSHRVICKRKKK